MAEFKLDRFKYIWRGDWAGGTAYKRDDVVRVNGKSYVCIKTHTANSIFREDLNATIPDSNPPQPDPYWLVMTSGKSYEQEWTSGVDYNLGDIVLYYGSLYVCTTSHTSSTFSAEASNWDVFALSDGFAGDWTESTDYGLGALVKYNGIVYKCKTPHTSSTSLEINIGDWEIFHEGIEYQGDWQTATTYRKNDLVKFGPTIFRCTETHDSSGAELDLTKFELEFPGSQPAGTWADTIVYQQGDIVRYGGYLYIATENNVDVEPSRPGEDSTVTWRILATTTRFAGDWSLSGQFKTGDVVLRGGRLYKAVRDVNVVEGDDSSLTYLDPEVWELLSTGVKWQGAWVLGDYYSVGDVVYYLGTAYACNYEHRADSNNRPGDNGDETQFWDILVQAGVDGGLTTTGDLLTVGLNREFAGDGSTQGSLRLPIGESGEVLSVAQEQELFWREFTAEGDVIYVAPNGADLPGCGLIGSTPFKTVRHALEFVEDTIAAGTPVTVKVAAGRYEEIAPLTVPAGTAVVGDELRATSFVAAGALPKYENDFDKVKEYLVYFRTFLIDIILNNDVTPTDGNNEPQVKTGDISSAAVAQDLSNLLTEFEQYIEFRVESGDTDPTESGSNSLSTDLDRLAASAQLKANKEFIGWEIYAYLKERFPNDTTITIERILADVRSIVRGLAEDIKYSGNHRTLRAGRRYANAVNGSQLEDLFYVRDTTGIRQASVKGLQGTLNPPGVFGLYQRPTGGACVSLDPGWGPDDDRCWITNRSPYVQGVTNIGDSCVGAKIDGSLHTEGTKSMVFNDFTQLLSDGVGAWVLNGARAELVSVFTYYCAVGYLAEDGGIIRATNGNNSYGLYGSIADGNDPTETPQTVTVNNRNNEAQVLRGFAGGLTDKIFAFEYSNCGQDYTSADATIVGAGADADIEYISDFRDGGLFNARLINTQGSGQEGGAGYLTRQGYAQVTADSSQGLILSATDPTQFLSEIQGMRIIIISGDGVGQYGIVDSFDAVTKVCGVVKDSDGSPGWDHIIPGYPIEASLNSTAYYRIEARVSVPGPGFSSTNKDLASTFTFVDATHGGTTALYNNVTGDPGTGTTFETDPVTATWRVERAGDQYTVTSLNPGAGYAVGDVIVLEGDDLGDASETPDNDITITVTEVSDDSTNSIVSFTYEGTPLDPIFVAIHGSDGVIFGYDAENWYNATLSFTGTYKRVIAGDNRFVAIAENDNKLSFSYTGDTWTTRSLPITETWSDVAYGDGKWALIATTTNNMLYSTDGLTWTQYNMPASADWSNIAYGQGRFVAITNDTTQDVATSEDGQTWTEQDGVLPSASQDWVSLKYGANRFLAVASDGTTAYSVDRGETWTAGGSISNITTVTDVKYSQGLFFAVGNDGSSTTAVATSEDGLIWTSRTLSSSREWQTATFAKLKSTGKGTWVTFANNSSTNGVCHINTGAQAKVRSDVGTGSFDNVVIWDPGSGYDAANPPTFTITDPNPTTNAEIEARIADGVLPQPDFINRGAGYRTTSSVITITGDGFADIIPESTIITLSGLTSIPGPGVQVRIDGILDEDTDDPDDLALFSGVAITDKGDDGSGNNTRIAEIQLSPRLRNEYNVEHGTTVTLRERYSQCRITGHDFLDIGTGNFADTNYPDIYAGGNFFTAAPENEVLEQDGGRVFYVSTDQDGNFRAGELFAVNQATGVVTVSAEYFDLDGLSELALGGVRLGGSGTVVTEFSTDGTFSADSNNVIPTQRAIATFLEERLSVGGENLETNAITAGLIKIGTTEDTIENVTEQYIEAPVQYVFDGVYDSVDEFGVVTQKQSAIQGTIVQQMLYFKQYDDTMQ